MKPAGLVVRLVAWVLDLIFIGILMDAFGRYEVGLLFGATSIDTNAAAAGVLLFIFWITMILYSLIEVVSGRSPAKWILGVLVRRQDGGKASLGRRIVRSLGNIIPFMFIPVLGLLARSVLLGALLVLIPLFILGALLVFGPAKQTFADLLAGTALFRRKSPAA